MRDLMGICSVSLLLPPGTGALTSSTLHVLFSLSCCFPDGNLGKITENEG